MNWSSSKFLSVSFIEIRLRLIVLRTAEAKAYPLADLILWCSLALLGCAEFCLVAFRWKYWCEGACSVLAGVEKSSCK